jgi:hypothetical protein
MMMHARLGVWLDGDSPSPDFLGTDARVIDRSLAEHARRLGRVGIKPVTLDNPHAVVLPGCWSVVRMVVVLVVMCAHQTFIGRIMHWSVEPGLA